MLKNHVHIIKGLLLALLVLACDQWSKRAVLAVFAENPEPRHITSFFDLTLVWNRGMSFGLFSGQDARLAMLLITGGITCAVLVWLWRAREGWQFFPLGLVIGGAIGNIIDRLLYGAVVDFLYFHLGEYYWPAFNVADSAVVTGVLLIMWRSLIFPEQKTM